jgi:hypothetical protein
VDERIAELEAENERLRKAIEAHRAYRTGFPCMPGDIKLWEALD